jgi:hypothetical protein
MDLRISSGNFPLQPIPAAALSKALVCGSSLTEIVGSNPSRGMDVCLFLVSVVCCQIEGSAWDLSFDQRSPTECGVSECLCEASIMRRSTGGCRARKKIPIRH